MRCWHAVARRWRISSGRCWHNLMWSFAAVEFRTSVAAGKQADLHYEIVRREGYNAKQNNVRMPGREILKP